jgi:hypothetical protein
MWAREREKKGSRGLLLRRALKIKPLEKGTALAQGDLSAVCPRASNLHLKSLDLQPGRICLRLLRRALCTDCNLACSHLQFFCFGFSDTKALEQCRRRGNKSCRLNRQHLWVPVWIFHLVTINAEASCVRRGAGKIEIQSSQLDIFN